MSDLDPTTLKAAVDNTLERHLEGRAYDDSLVANWSKNIRAEIVDELQRYKLKNAKLIVHVTILQQGHAGMHVASSTLWDPDTDLSLTTVWESDKVYCSTSVFVLRF